MQNDGHTKTTLEFKHNRFNTAVSGSFRINNYTARA